jgi:hypothetical protein
MTYNAVLVSSPGQMKDFLQLPFLVYRDDHSWVAPITSEVRRTLDKKRNPYFADAELELFVCYKSSVIAARTAIVINGLHQKKFSERSAFFGFFESINDPEAVSCLFAQAEAYCAGQGIDVLEGPFNPNHYSELGLQVSHYGTPPAFFQSYNPAYYRHLLRAVGFRPTAVFQTMKNENIREYMQERYGSLQGSVEVDGYKVRSLSLADLENELERIREVNNDAFSSNWHFLPLSREEYLFSAKFLRLVTRPELVKIIEHQGRPVGVVHCVLDINPLLRKMNGKTGLLKALRFLYGRRKIKTLIIFSVGIKKAYQHTQAFRLLLQAFCQTVQKYEVLETTWLSGENSTVMASAEHLGLKPDKQFAIYKKSISPETRKEEFR